MNGTIALRRWQKRRREARQGKLFRTELYPWEMQVDRWVKSLGGTGWRSLSFSRKRLYRRQHESLVQDALREGQTVPEEILANYPVLAVEEAGWTWKEAGSTSMLVSHGGRYAVPPGGWWWEKAEAREKEEKDLQLPGTSGRLR